VFSKKEKNSLILHSCYFERETVKGSCVAVCF